MDINVRSLLGSRLFYANKTIGIVDEVLFFIETGKLSCLKTCERQYFPAESVFFDDDELKLSFQQPTKKQGENWLGFHATNETGECIGNVYDLEFSPQMLVITRVVVMKRFLFFPVSRHVFPFERIIDVRKKTVVFNTNTAKPAEGIMLRHARSAV